jgi:predicted metal-dependent hydrolase
MVRYVCSIYTGSVKIDACKWSSAYLNEILYHISTIYFIVIHNFQLISFIFIFSLHYRNCFLIFISYSRVDERINGEPAKVIKMRKILSNYLRIVTKGDCFTFIQDFFESWEEDHANYDDRYYVVLTHLLMSDSN